MLREEMRLCWIKRIETLQVDGDGVKGRPRKRWREVFERRYEKEGTCREDAWDRSRWKRMLWEGHRQGKPQYTGKNNLVKINSCSCCYLNKKLDIKTIKYNFFFYVILCYLHYY